MVIVQSYSYPGIVSCGPFHLGGGGGSWVCEWEHVTHFQMVSAISILTSSFMCAVIFYLNNLVEVLAE